MSDVKITYDWQEPQASWREMAAARLDELAALWANETPRPWFALDAAAAHIEEIAALWANETPRPSRWARLKWRIAAWRDDLRYAFPEARYRLRAAWSVLRKGY